MATDSTATSTKLKVTELDHIVLRVKDVERAIEFYIGVLGLGLNLPRTLETTEM